MRLRNIPGSREMVAGSPFVVQTPQEYPGRWRQLLGREFLAAEIGMGKGRFLTEMARRNPAAGFVGIEKYSSVLARALQKLEVDPLQNLRLVCLDAENIGAIFAPGELRRIYLNFPDPWPKARHAKRRLCSRRFLDRFGRVLSREGQIELRTDNRALFDFAMEEFAQCGWQAFFVTYDLHGGPGNGPGRGMPGEYDEDVMTEYEERFSREGAPICECIMGR